MLRCLAIVATATAFIACEAPADAQTRTCAAREQLCRTECLKVRAGGRCDRTCDQRKSDCLSTGCWGNAADSRCGFVKS